MRRRFFLLLICILLLVPATARADEYDELRTQIIESMESGEKFNVSSWNLTQEELLDIYFELYCTGQLPWYSDTYFDWNASPDGIVSVFMPRGSKALRYDEAAYEQKMAELIAETCTEGMPQWQMALNVHDYIIANCRYDELLVRNSGYHALVKGQTACFGYAQLYMDVMRRIGIPCQIVECPDTGDGVGHAWNVVQLDGSWYHVDLTWDDPLPDIQGQVFHDHFLKSDSQFRSAENGHDFEWNTDIVCEGGIYSTDAFWEDIDSQIVMAGSTIYLRRTDDDRVYLYARDRETGEEEKLHSFRRVPQQFGDGLYLFYVSGLSLWSGRLYFCSEDTVWSMLPDGSDRREEYDYPGRECIIGCHVNDGTIYLELSDAQGELTEQEIPLEDAQYHIHEYTETTVAPTCTAGGYTEGVCACGLSYRAQEVPMADHNIETATLEDGTVVRSCTNCSYREEEPPETVPQPAEPAEEPEDAPNLLLPGLLAAAVLVAVLLVTKRRRS